MPQRSFPAGLSAQKLFDALPDPCILLNARGETLTWNEAFERLLGRAPDLAQHCEAAIQKEADRPRTVQVGDQVFQLDRDRLPVQGGLLVRLRQADSGERQLASLRAFGGSAGHDLQEPVRKMLAFSSLLSRQSAGQLDADGAQSLEFISDAALRMRTLISEVLAYIEAATRPLALEQVSLSDEMNEVLKARTDAIADTQAVLDLGELPEVTGDAALLRQVLAAVFDNALKFRRGPGVQISIAATRHDDHHRIEVRDDGIGVDPELVSKLFTPFGRLHPRETYPGAALGLARARLIIERHDGAIWLEPGKGEGACFVFTLPVSA